MRLQSMPSIIVAASLFYLALPIFGQASSAPGNLDRVQFPSKEEIGDLVNKAGEYVKTYRAIFTHAKPSLARAVPDGFYAAAMQLSDQADTNIAALRKNGPSAYALVTFIAILDDMSLNAAKAYAATLLVAAGDNAANGRDNPAVTDAVSLAQGGKNCSDISELLLHATLRFIYAEETILRSTLDHAGQK